MAARRAVDQELTRESIMHAAHQLFNEKGYQNVSMRQIAKELNYSHGAIYYHFKNKAELFYALVKADFTLLDEKLMNVLDQEELSNKEKTKKILESYIEFGLRNQSQYELMFLTKDEEVISYMIHEPNASYDQFAQAIYALSGKQLSANVIWSVFLSLHGFVTHYCKTGMTFEEVEPLVKAHVLFLMKGLS
ncbi:TetR/AcrR family transcriptional regulator [Metabacillus idriensis]|uniref:TetR family transcriptional regulator n=1 Tax=Metabacillus idriensis TaxID=324768 RepID=A0A6I2M8F5_9BACI|nr:TetR/AcrR family transcriptional regulator [Metabacillus idriensis]MCM3597360.1 TetR/AcrR family transcriptional regulator [Metabacillus idriensis]MRX54109.1 TetR family transcriptional regulator [Metabacillus idriensis]OHR73288.1 TetR family transcriptional regulator [Bacillus sp. HMSC76G11]